MQAVCDDDRGCNLNTAVLPRCPFPAQVTLMKCPLLHKKVQPQHCYVAPLSLHCSGDLDELSTEELPVLASALADMEYRDPFLLTALAGNVAEFCCISSVVMLIQ